MFRRNTQKLAAVFVGTAALLAGALATLPTAQAATDWELWDVTNHRAVAVGDVLSAHGNLTFATIVNGGGMRIECRVPTGSNLFTHTVTSADQLTAAPGADLLWSITPEPVISTVGAGPKQGICRDTTPPATWATGVRLAVTTSGAAFDLSVTTPGIGAPGVYAGTLALDLDMPASAITYWDPAWGCGATGPNTPTRLTASYNTATGVSTPTPNQPLYATPTPGCTITNTRLVTGSITFDPHLSVRY